MSTVWFLAIGAATLLLIQLAVKWQKSKNAPWYFWALAAITYLFFFTSVPVVYTLAGESTSKPALFTGLVAAIVLVVLVVLTRLSLILPKKLKSGQKADKSVSA